MDPAVTVRRGWRAWALAAVLVATTTAATTTTGCGAAPASGPVDFPADPLAVLSSASGQFQIAVRTSPRPLVKGVNTVQYVVTDPVTGDAIDGLDVTATPWMPSHAHGTGARTLVDAQGAGVYQIGNVYFYMDGTWELRSALASGAGTDTVIPSFDVP